MAAFATGCREHVNDAAQDGVEFASANCQASFLPLTGRVVDQANVIPPEKEALLTNRLAAVEQQTGHQMVIATVDQLQGKSIEQYSLCLANHWKIGDAKRNDGVMMLVAPIDRKARIEVARGLEPQLTDDEALKIMQGQIIPQFRTGDFPAGISAGVEAIIGEISL